MSHVIHEPLPMPSLQKCILMEHPDLLTLSYLALADYVIIYQLRLSSYKPSHSKVYIEYFLRDSPLIDNQTLLLTRLSDEALARKTVYKVFLIIV